jgi:hypothetical protein
MCLCTHSLRWVPQDLTLAYGVFHTRHDALTVHLTFPCPQQQQQHLNTSPLKRKHADRLAQAKQVSTSTSQELLRHSACHSNMHPTHRAQQCSELMRQLRCITTQQHAVFAPRQIT